MMYPLKKHRVEMVTSDNKQTGLVQKKEGLLSLGERIKPLLAHSVWRERSISRYTLFDIEKAMDLAG